MEFKFIDKIEYLERISEFQKLFMDSFNRKISKEFLKWRYVDNPMEDILAHVAIENGKMIANYSASPCKIYINGKIEKAALSMTTMTHPNFRGKGLFPKLANGLYELMENRGYKAIVGFPNNNSHLTFIKRLNWKDIYEIPTMKLDLFKIKDFTSCNNLKIVKDDNFLLDYSKLINNNNDKVKIHKDVEYLRWRFKENPVNKYDNYVLVENENVIASIISKKFNNCEVDIVEINSLENYYTEEILKYIIQKEKSNSKNKYINMWCQLNHSLHLIVEKIGFVNCEPISYFGVRNINENSINLSTYNNWHIQMGDSDVY